MSIGYHYDFLFYLDNYFNSLIKLFSVLHLELLSILRVLLGTLAKLFFLCKNVIEIGYY